MESLNKLIRKTAEAMNALAGWALAVSMLLATLNIILRSVFGKPLLGTYEWVGFLAAVTAGLGLAFCAAVDGHISIDLLVDKMKPAVRKAVLSVGGLISAILMGAVTVGIFMYAGSLLKSGEVSATTQIPYYYFVYAVGFGFAVLSLILFTAFARSAGRQSG